MTAPSLPRDEEARRLAALRALGAIDGEPDARFDVIVDLIALTCAAPIALISLVDEDRQRLLARKGVDIVDTPRQDSFCAHTILSDAPLVVADARADPRFADNPLVTGPPGIRAYAGAPLVDEEGLRLGAVCAIHTEPVALSASQVQRLVLLSRLTAAALRDRAAARRLAAQTSLLRSFVASSPVAMAMFDRDMRYLAASARWVADYGLDSSALVGRSHYEVFPEIPARWKDVHRRCLHGAAMSAPEDRFERQNGAVQYIRWDVRPWRDAQGEIAGLIMQSEDVTEARRQDRMIRASEARLRASFEFERAAAWELDFEERDAFATEGFAELFGRPFKAADAACYLLDAAHPDDVAKVRLAWTEHWAGGPPIDLDFRIVRPDGEVRWLHALARIERNAAGAPTRIRGLFKDVTDRTQRALELEEARKAADAANAAKSAFLATMSHEIRTPLNGVVGVADVLARRGLEPEQAEMVDLIRTSAATLERLLTEVLDLAKIEAGRAPVEESEFDLQCELEAICQLFAVNARQKGVALTARYSPRARGLFFGDIARLRQAWQNLVANAVKFTERGAVDVAVEVVDAAGAPSELIVVVRDTGIGFDPELGDTLFDAFLQADSSITRRYGGSGLGLTIARAGMKAIGGSIAANSKPGEGSAFTVRAPLRRVVTLEDYDTACAERVAAEPSGPEEPSDLRGVRVLMAEDNPTNRRVAALMLEALGVELCVAPDGAVALEALSARSFDLVLMDLQMPVMDGLAAIKEIRAREAGEGRPRMAIAVLSANAMAHHREEALAAGADSHIAKPLTVHALHEGMTAAMRAAKGGPRGAG